MMHVVDKHFVDIIHFLTIGTAPEGYTSQQKRELLVCATNFYVIIVNLYKMGSDEIIRRYVLDFEQGSILVEAHGGVARGH